MKEKLRCGETHYGDSPYRSDVHGILLHGRRGRLLSVLYTAGGEGLHPAVLLLYGIPGCEKNIDLAQDLRRALRQSRCCVSAARSTSTRRPSSTVSRFAGPSSGRAVRSFGACAGRPTIFCRITG